MGEKNGVRKFKISQYVYSTETTSNASSLLQYMPHVHIQIDKNKLNWTSCSLSVHFEIVFGLHDILKALA